MPRRHAARSSNRTPAKFLNVDLDLHGRTGTRDVLESFGERVVVLHRGPSLTSLELARDPRTIDVAIGRYADLVESLPRRARSAWNRVRRRVLSVGLASGTAPSTQFRLCAHSVARAAAVGCELEIVLYA
jgi:hypothetical protein